MTNNRMNNNYNRNTDYNNRTTIYYDASSSRQMSDERTRRNIERPTEEARAYTRSKRRKQNVLLTSAALALVAAIAVGTMAFAGVFNPKTKTADTAPTVVSATVDKGANKAAQNAKQATPQTETKQNNTAVKPAQNTSQNTTQNTAQNKSNTQTAQTNNKQNTNQTAQTQQSAKEQTKSTQKSEDKIENVNGERVYKDTKRQAPDKTGTPAHYYANGKTSYGFNWDYNADNSSFVVKCDYNFNQQQYDFTFYGSTPGTSHVTLYYYTSDTNKVPVNLTVTVDSNLNVTVG